MTLDEAKAKIAVGWTYRHFKGGYYRVLAIARHSETQESMVIYQALNEERGVWVRPASMWLEEVRPGVRRFEVDLSELIV